MNRVGSWLVLFLMAVAYRPVIAEEPSQPPTAERSVLAWQQLPPLPDKHGFAGAFCGVSNDALLVAGGANFPDGRPWDGAEKVWHDTIFVLEAAAGKEAEAKWKVAGKLPRPLAYGVSISTDQGVVCLGGGDADRHYCDVFLIKWTGDEIETVDLPSMPGPAAFCCGAMVGQTIYVAGGQDWPKPRTTDSASPTPPRSMKTFWALDLAKQGSNRQWQTLDPWPGRSRILAAAAVQDGKFFLVGGAALEADEEGNNQRVFLRDGYCYDPKQSDQARRWTRIADLPHPVAAAPSPAAALGQSHFAVVGGDDGRLFGQEAKLKETHPGFPPTILGYHTITDTWVQLGTFPKDVAAGVWPPVTTNTCWWRGRYVVPTGEARPGVRTPNVFWARPQSNPQGFGWLDYGVLAAYLVALVAMGFYFSRREKTTSDFFLAGRRVPWWAAGLSIFGTQLSAITFMAIPGKAFHTDWVFFVANMMILVVAPVVVYCYLPYYRRLNVTTAYEYLEVRFNVTARLLGSATFVLFQLGRMGVVLYLPAAALSTVTGMDVYLCILLMGVLSTLYTVLGGIEAVIWTDVLQVFVLLGGALLALLIIAWKLDGGFATIVAEAGREGKLNMANWTWDVSTAAIWIVVLGKPFEMLVSYTADQTVVQRYLTTADQKQAARGIWTNAVLTVPASILFFGVGTALWAFYRAHPAQLDATGKIDEIFPWFIAQQLPMGVAGLVIAGLFAAAMSSLDSSMNSMATAITTDFYKRINPLAADHRCLVLARWLTVVLGALGTGLALYMAYLGSTSMLDQYSKIIGLFGGGLAGLFAVGIFTRRTTGAGAIVGLLASAVILYFITTNTSVHFFVYPIVGMGSCFLVAYAVSALLPAREWT